MYTAAIVIAILGFRRDIVKVFEEKPANESDGCLFAVFQLAVAAFLIWCVILLVGVARFVNGDAPALGNMGF